MRDEIETTLRLLGVTKLSQLGPHLVSTYQLDSSPVPITRLSVVGAAMSVNQTRADCRRWVAVLFSKLNTKAIDPLLADRPSFGPNEQQGSTWFIRN